MSSIRESLEALADAFDISLDGLDDDALDIVAIRLIATEQRAPTPRWMQQVVNEVKRAEGTIDGGRLQSVKTADESPVPSAPSADLAGSPDQLSPPRAQSGDPAPTCCTPINVPYPSGWWIVHSKFCETTPSAKIRRLGHPAGEAKITQRLTATHKAEDSRAAVIPIRRVGSCEKCGAATTRGLYCRDCRALLDIVKVKRG